MRHILQQGDRSLHDAALRGQTAVVKILLDSDADINAVNEARGSACEAGAMIMCVLVCPMSCVPRRTASHVSRTQLRGSCVHVLLVHMQSKTCGLTCAYFNDCRIATRRCTWRLSMVI